VFKLNPYEQLLASIWHDLPKEVRNAHAIPLSASGDFVVRRGNGRLANYLADRLKLPPRSDRSHVKLKVSGRDDKVSWERSFDGVHYPATIQWANSFHLLEKAGPATYVFQLERRGNSLLYRQVAFRLFGLPMPRSLSMRVWAKVDPAKNGWRVKVSIYAPMVGRLCHYAGNMRAE